MFTRVEAVTIVLTSEYHSDGIANFSLQELCLGIFKDTTNPHDLLHMSFLLSSQRLKLLRCLKGVRGERARAGLDLVLTLWQRHSGNNCTSLNQGSGTQMREKNQGKIFFRGREGEGGRGLVGGWETRDEEVQQLNIPQPVVNSE